MIVVFILVNQHFKCISTKLTGKSFTKDGTTEIERGRI